MQKKTRSRLSEVFFIFICVCCSLFSIYQFYQSLNRTLVKDEEPIATISFKYKTAQRKFIDENLWDRLQQDSPVYEGDTIRTAEQSEATLNFSDGNVMELQSNTMIRVSLSEEGGAEIDFSGGAISVRTTDNASMKIRSGTSVVDVAAGASVAAAGNGEEDGNLKVAVKEGNASFTGEGGTIDLEAGKVTEISATGSIEEHLLSVNYPEDNFRTMTFKKSNTDVDFSWESAGRAVILELSDTKNFDKITTSYTYRNVSSVSLNMKEGAHWWRLTTIPATADEQPETVSGKLTVLYSPVPTPISPANGTTTTFRTKLPQIRLSWSESERATSYRLDIADNSNMLNPVISQRCTTTSAIITSLAEGTWYWTVTPYYTFNDIGYAESSKKSYFVINRSLELNPPTLMAPEADGLVCTKSTNSDGSSSFKTIMFSWKNDAEASNYDFALYSGNSSTPILTKTVTGSYCQIDTSKEKIPNGDCSWDVTIRDDEGNTKTSARRAFFAIDADIEQKTLNPPDKYRVTESLSDVEFTWKTNVPYATTLQVATDRSFRNIVLSKETSDPKAAGKLLPAGTYYWRITSKAGSAVISTAAKTLTVEPLLSQAKLEQTQPLVALRTEDQGSILVSGTPEINWQKVPDADYYHFTLVSTAKPNAPIIDQDMKTTNVPLDIETLGAGTYRWTVSAFRNETMAASRNWNNAASSTFTVKDLAAPAPTYISNTKTIDGVTAWTSPASFTWKPADAPLNWTLRLYKGTRQINFWTKATVQLPQLEEGTYTWMLTAAGADKQTVYEKELAGFTVKPIPALAAPIPDVPADQTVFGVDYLKDNTTIRFTWKPVQDATEYIFTLTNTAGEQIVSETLSAGTTEYLQDITDLTNDTLTWTVQAKRTLKGQDQSNKEKVIESEVNSAQFSIELPVLTLPEIKDFGKRYGM